VQVNIVKLSNWRIPRQFINQWLKDLVLELNKTTKHRINNKEIHLVFVTQNKIKKLNQDFRSKAKVTDILSFSGFTESELGELVLSGQQINRQAKEHQLKNNEELGYLLIHGVLHLLGYEHEKGGQAARQMFELQDKIFAKLREKHFYEH
jgi:probable rRNA maturation factor